MDTKNKTSRNPWFWIPSLYFAQGLPYILVMTVSVIMYKRLGLSNTDIALYTSWLYLPWVIKPFWSPFVDIVKTKRSWILLMQFLIGGGLAGVAFTIPAENFVQYTMAFFWLIAFSSATYDIAADGFYMIGLTQHQQVFFVGIRSTFYRIAMLTGQGLLVILAGYLEETTGSIPEAWSYSFILLTVIFVLFGVYHYFIIPRVESPDTENELAKNVLAEFIETFTLFFKKEKIGLIIAFILFYRLGESQLVKIANPFLLDTIEAGGLALDTKQVGFIYGTIGLIFLTAGGITGGILAARDGLKKWLWPMVFAINLPNLVYVYLAFFTPGSFEIISACVALEQFGYGFGFTAFLLYIIYISDGKYKTAHYALATGFMALGMMLPGMASGWIQELIGYKMFFIWVMISTIPAFLITRFIDISPTFGIKNKDEKS